MPKAETTFRPIGDSEQKMHGNPAILISGFSATDQQTLHARLPQWGIENVPLVVIAPDTLALTLEQATALEDQTNFNQEPELPRAVVMSGLQERQLNSLMNGYREAAFERPLWASVTPHSAAWTVKYLLIELCKEREAMRQAILDEKAKKQSDTETKPA